MWHTMWQERSHCSQHCTLPSCLHSMLVLLTGFYKSVPFNSMTSLFTPNWVCFLFFLSFYTESSSVICCRRTKQSIGALKLSNQVLLRFITSSTLIYLRCIQDAHIKYFSKSNKNHVYSCTLANSIQILNKHDLNLEKAFSKSNIMSSILCAAFETFATVVLTSVFTI